MYIIKSFNYLYGIIAKNLFLEFKVIFLCYHPHLVASITLGLRLFLFCLGGHYVIASCSWMPATTGSPPPLVVTATLRGLLLTSGTSPKGLLLCPWMVSTLKRLSQEDHWNLGFLSSWPLPQVSYLLPQILDLVNLVLT